MRRYNSEIKRTILKRVLYSYNRQSSERGRMRICDFMSALWNDRN